MKKLIYGIIIALFCSGCDDFLKEYSQSQTVAKAVSYTHLTLPTTSRV